MKRYLSLSCLSLVCLALPAAAQAWRMEGKFSAAERRVALVIGNGDYPTAPLPNPVNDARDLATALGELKFEVLYHENLRQKDMRTALRTFGERIRAGGVGLFYYAGHAIQLNGRNYLIPVNARISKEAEIEPESVDVSLLLTEMAQAQNHMNIVILDACRNNPFASRFRAVTGNLAPLDAPSGTLIAYATAPGSEAWDGKGRNGVYTRELLKTLRTPGLSIEEVFKNVRVSVQRQTAGRQTPWESSSLLRDFCFRPLEEKWAEGIWEGTAYQSGPDKAWPVKLAVQNNSYSIEYPALTCAGEWTLTGKKGSQAMFRERIVRGGTKCEDGGEVVLEKVSNTQLVFKYVSPRTNEIIASAILNKRPSQRVYP